MMGRSLVLLARYVLKIPLLRTVYTALTKLDIFDSHLVYFCDVCPPPYNLGSGSFHKGTFSERPSSRLYLYFFLNSEVHLKK